jgi:hypothetical protein
MAKHWSLEEDKIVLENAMQDDMHLRRSFKKSAKKLRRTPEAVCTRYYKLINKPLIQQNEEIRTS